MNLLVTLIVSFLTGVMASLGLGGGMVLILYLTLIAGTGQLEAQGINLFFFLPIAAVSLFFHTKNKLVEWKKVIPTIITGCVFSLLFSFVATACDVSLLSRMFGGFITVIGITILFQSKSEKGRKD